MHSVRQMYSHFTRKWFFTFLKERISKILAILLHDIGHDPLQCCYSFADNETQYFAGWWIKKKRVNGAYRGMIEIFDNTGAPKANGLVFQQLIWMIGLLFK